MGLQPMSWWFPDDKIFQKDLANLPGFLSQFCKMTLPWYYLSRLERVAFVDAVDIYSISMNEPTLKSSAIPVDNGFLKLSLGKGEAVSIVPAGQVLTR